MKNLFLLSTDKPSSFYKNLLTDKFFILENSFMDVSECNREYQNINITSENEDINENDYIITKDGRLFQVSYLLSKKIENASKVVLTTDKDLIADGVQSIPDEFLEWFVNNPNCEEVRVVDVRYDISTLTNDVKRYPNLDVPDYKIIIPERDITVTYISENKEKSMKDIAEELAETAIILTNISINKEENLEEVKPPIGKFIIDNAVSTQGADGAYYHYSEVCKLLRLQEEQDKNKYSEEEVIKLLEKRDKYLGNWLPPVKWLEQIKKYKI